jgi:hypothetical protein
MPVEARMRREYAADPQTVALDGAQQAALMVRLLAPLRSTASRHASRPSAGHLGHQPVMLVLSLAVHVEVIDGQR